MIIMSARRTWITLRKLRSIQATTVLAQTMIMAETIEYTANFSHVIGKPSLRADSIQLVKEINTPHLRDCIKNLA